MRARCYGASPGSVGMARLVGMRRGCCGRLVREERLLEHPRFVVVSAASLDSARSIEPSLLETGSDNPKFGTPTSPRPQRRARKRQVISKASAGPQRTPPAWSATIRHLSSSEIDGTPDARREHAPEARTRLDSVGPRRVADTKGRRRPSMQAALRKPRPSDRGPCGEREATLPPSPPGCARARPGTRGRTRPRGLPRPARSPPRGS
jgi:hypothetical protein